MRTFIDEAGIFIVPGGNKHSAVSCVGGFTIPESCIDEVFGEFQELKASWGVDADTELKGRQLDEARVAHVINLLARFPVIFCATAIDMATQNRGSLQRHKQIQARKFTEKLDERFHPNVVAELNSLKDRLERLSLQLYVQSVCGSELLAHILQVVTLRYSVEAPVALSDFLWIVDAKDGRLTPHEELWLDTVRPALQAKSFKSPLIQLIEGDYSHFDQFCAEMPEAPEHVRDAVLNPKPFSYIDTNKIFRDKIIFKNSESDVGIQLVDILTTTLRRAMNGNLQIEGWGNLGRLMIASPRNGQAIQLIDLSQDGPMPRPRKKPPYWHVLPHLDRAARSPVEI